MTQVSWHGSDSSGFTESFPGGGVGRYTYTAGSESPALAAGDVVIIASSAVGTGTISGPTGATVDFTDDWTDVTTGQHYAVRLAHYVVSSPSGLTLDTDFSNDFDILNIVGMVISGASSTVTFNGPHREGAWTETGEKDVPYGGDTNFELVYNYLGGSTGYHHADTITGYYDLGTPALRVYWHWSQGNVPLVWKVGGTPDFSPFDQAVGSGQNFGPSDARTHGVFLGTPKSVIRISSHRIRHRLSVS